MNTKGKQRWDAGFLPSARRRVTSSAALKVLENTGSLEIYRFGVCVQIQYLNAVYIYSILFNDAVTVSKGKMMSDSRFADDVEGSCCDVS